MKGFVDYQENRSSVLCRNLTNFAYREHCSRKCVIPVVCVKIGKGM